MIRCSGLIRFFCGCGPGPLDVGTSDKLGVIQSQRKTRRKSVQSTSAAPIESEDNTALARALSGIVASRASARAKLDQIESLIAKPGKSSLPKRKKGNNPPTDDNSIRGQWDKLGRVFKHIPDKSRNSVAASISVGQNSAVNIESVANDIVDIERGLDSLLANHGVKSKKVRGELARAFARVATKAKSGQDVRPAITAINKLDFSEASPSSNVPPLPAKAALLYKDRPEKSQNIVDFLLDKRWWGTWTSVGALSRPAFRAYDKGGYDCLRVWIHKHGKPAHLDMPDRSQIIDRIIAAGPTSEAEIARVGGAVRARIYRRSTRNL